MNRNVPIWDYIVISVLEWSFGCLGHYQVQGTLAYSVGLDIFQKMAGPDEGSGSGSVPLQTGFV